MDLEGLPEVTISIFESKKKLVATLKLDLKASGLTNKAKEEVLEIKGSNSVPIGAFEILTSLAILLVLGLSTVLSQTFKAAAANPVDSLRHE